jgi:hypothetical protein
MTGWLVGDSTCVVVAKLEEPGHLQLVVYCIAASWFCLQSGKGAN